MHEMPACLTSRPPNFDKDEWENMPLGWRVRAWRDLSDSRPVPREIYSALSTLPSWALVGPEDGYPKEWFNEQGYLLPNYRPGGVHRSRVRRSQLHDRLTRRCWRKRFGVIFDRLDGTWMAATGMVWWIVAAMIIGPLLAPHVAGRVSWLPIELLRWLLSISVFFLPFVFMVILGICVSLFCSMSSARAIRRRDEGEVG